MNLKRFRKARSLYLPRKAVINPIRRFGDCCLELFCGLQGAGKSYALVQHGLFLASLRRCGIVANFPFSPSITQFSPWIAYCYSMDLEAERRGIDKRWIRFTTDRDELLAYSDCVVLIDESQYFFGEFRQYLKKSTGERISHQFYADLAQCRKDRRDVLLAAHDHNLLMDDLLAQVAYLWACAKTPTGWRRDRFIPQDYKAYLFKASDKPAWVLRLKYRVFGLTGAWSPLLQSFYRSHDRLDTDDPSPPCRGLSPGDLDRFDARVKSKRPLNTQTTGSGSHLFSWVLLLFRFRIFGA